jgi:hypothetical protein
MVLSFSILVISKQLFMQPINYFEIVYYILTLILLSITAYYVAEAPIKAVRIGRQLNDEQRYEITKRNLFLNLFAYRGSPNHPVFVEALNHIDVVFYDEPLVLSAWQKYFESLQIDVEETETHRDKWKLLRTSLLKDIASSLGYGKLREVDIMKHYYSKGQEFQSNSEYDLRQAELTYYKSAAAMSQRLIERMDIQDNEVDKK